MGVRVTANRKEGRNGRNVLSIQQTHVLNLKNKFKTGSCIKRSHLFVREIPMPTA